MMIIILVIVIFMQIKERVSGIKLVILAKKEKLNNDRFILTDYFNINVNHSFQAIKNNNVNEESELNFKSLLNLNELNSYHNKIESVRNIFKKFEYETYKINEAYPDYSEIHSDISKEEIFKILDSF